MSDYPNTDGQPLMPLNAPPPNMYGPPTYQQQPQMYQQPPPIQTQPQVAYQPPVYQPMYQPPQAQPIIQVVQTNNNTPTTAVTTVEEVVHVSSNSHLTTSPVSAFCPFCKKNVVTVPETSCNFGNFLCCLITYPLIFIPWCLFQSSRGKELCCLDAIHKCPICGSIIGNYTAC